MRYHFFESSLEPPPNYPKSEFPVIWHSERFLTFGLSQGRKHLGLLRLILEEFLSCFPSLILDHVLPIHFFFFGCSFLAISHTYCSLWQLRIWLQSFHHRQWIKHSQMLAWWSRFLHLYNLLPCFFIFPPRLFTFHGFAQLQVAYSPLYIPLNGAVQCPISYSGTSTPTIFFFFFFFALIL